MKKFKAKETQSEPVAVPPSVLQHLDEATAKAVGLQEDLPDFVRRLSEASEGFRTASSAFQQQMHLKELANLVSRVAQTEDELDPFVVTEVYVAAEKVLVEFLLCIAGHKSAKSFAIYVAKFMFDTRLGRQERKRAKEFFRERLHRAVDSFLADDAASTIAVSSTEPIPAKTFFRLQQFEVVYESDQLAGEVPDRVMLKILASYGRQIDRFARVLTHRAREGTSAVQSLADQSDIFISLIKSATQLIQKCARRLHSSLQKEIKGGSASTEEGGEPKMSAEIQFLLETLPSSLVDIASTGGLSRDAVTQSLLLLLQILVTACSIDELTAVLSRWNESPHPERQGAVGSDVRTEVRKLEMLARSPQLRANPQTRLAAMRGLLVAVPATAGGAVDLFHLEDPSGADASVSLGRLSSEWSILATSFFEETAALCGHTDARLRHTALQSLHVWVSRLLGSSSFACSGAGGGGGGKSKREGGDIFPVFSGDEFTALPAGALPFSADETDGEEGPTPVSRGLWPDWTLFKLPEEKRAAIEEKTLAVVFENWDHPTKSLVAAAHDLWDLLLFQAGPGRISGGGGKGGDRERGENQNQGEGGDGREISGKSSRRSVVEEEEQRADDPPRPPPPSLLSITRRLSALPEAVASKKSLYLAFCSLLPLVDIAWLLSDAPEAQPLLIHHLLTAPLRDPQNAGASALLLEKLLEALASRSISVLRGEVYPLLTAALRGEREPLELSNLKPLQWGAGAGGSFSFNQKSSDASVQRDGKGIRARQRGSPLLPADLSSLTRAQISVAAAAQIIPTVHKADPGGLPALMAALHSEPTSASSSPQRIALPLVEEATSNRNLPLQPGVLQQQQEQVSQQEETEGGARRWIPDLPAAPRFFPAPHPSLPWTAAEAELLCCARTRGRALWVDRGVVEGGILIPAELKRALEKLGENGGPFSGLLVCSDSLHESSQAARSRAAKKILSRKKRAKRLAAAGAGDATTESEGTAGENAVGRSRPPLPAHPGGTQQLHDGLDGLSDEEGLLPALPASFSFFTVPLSRVCTGLVSGEEAVRLALLQTSTSSQKSSSPLLDCEMRLVRFFAGRSLKPPSSDYTAKCAQSAKRLFQRARDSCRKHVENMTEEDLAACLASRESAGRARGPASDAAIQEDKTVLVGATLQFLEKMRKTLMAHLAPSAPSDLFGAALEWTCALIEVWAQRPASSTPAAAAAGGGGSGFRSAAGCAALAVTGFFSEGMRVFLLNAMATNYAGHRQTAARCLRSFPDMGLRPLHLKSEVFPDSRRASDPAKKKLPNGAGPSAPSAISPSSIEAAEQTAALLSEAIESLSESVWIMLESVRPRDFSCGIEIIRLILRRGLGMPSDGSVPPLPFKTLYRAVTGVEGPPSNSPLEVESLSSPSASPSSSSSSSSSFSKAQMIFMILERVAEEVGRRTRLLKDQKELLGQRGFTLHGVVAVLTEALRVLPSLPEAAEALSESEKTRERMSKFCLDLMDKLLEVCTTMFGVISSGVDAVLLSGVARGTLISSGVDAVLLSGVARGTGSAGGKETEDSSALPPVQGAVLSGAVDCRGHPILHKKHRKGAEGEGEGGEEGEEEEEENVLVVASWMAVREVGEALQALFSWLPLRGSASQGADQAVSGGPGKKGQGRKQGKQGRQEGGRGARGSVGLSEPLVPAPLVFRMGARLLTFLLATRHPAAMDRLFGALTVLAGRLLASGDLRLCEVPTQWVDLVLGLLSVTEGDGEGEGKEPEGDSGAAWGASLPPALRRSTALGLSFVALLRAEPGKVAPCLLPRAVSRLSGVAGEEEKEDEEQEERRNCRVHALNCLRAIIRCGPLSTSTEAHVGKILALAVQRLGDSHWGTRNAANLLFVAAARRLFGADNEAVEAKPRGYKLCTSAPSRATILASSPLTLEELRAHYPDLHSCVVAIVCRLAEAVREDDQRLVGGVGEGRTDREREMLEAPATSALLVLSRMRLLSIRSVFSPAASDPSPSAEPSAAIEQAPSQSVSPNSPAASLLPLVTSFQSILGSRNIQLRALAARLLANCTVEEALQTRAFSPPLPQWDLLSQSRAAVSSEEREGTSRETVPFGAAPEIPFCRILLALHAAALSDCRENERHGWMLFCLEVLSRPEIVPGVLVMTGGGSGTPSRLLSGQSAILMAKVPEAVGESVWSALFAKALSLAFRAARTDTVRGVMFQIFEILVSDVLLEEGSEAVSGTEVERCVWSVKKCVSEVATGGEEGGQQLDLSSSLDLGSTPMVVCGVRAAMRVGGRARAVDLLCRLVSTGRCRQRGGHTLEEGLRVLRKRIASEQTLRMDERQERKSKGQKTSGQEKGGEENAKEGNCFSGEELNQMLLMACEVLQAAWAGAVARLQGLKLLDAVLGEIGVVCVGSGSFSEEGLEGNVHSATGGGTERQTYLKNVRIATAALRGVLPSDLRNPKFRKCALAVASQCRPLLFLKEGQENENVKSTQEGDLGRPGAAIWLRGATSAWLHRCGDPAASEDARLVAVEALRRLAFPLRRSLEAAGLVSSPSEEGEKEKGGIAPSESEGMWTFVFAVLRGFFLLLQDELPEIRDGAARAAAPLVTPHMSPLLSLSAATIGSTPLSEDGKEQRNAPVSPPSGGHSKGGSFLEPRVTSRALLSLTVNAALSSAAPAVVVEETRKLVSDILLSVAPSLKDVCAERLAVDIRLLEEKVDGDTQKGEGGSISLRRLFDAEPPNVLSDDLALAHTAVSFLILGEGPGETPELRLGGGTSSEIWSLLQSPLDSIQLCRRLEELRVVLEKVQGEHLLFGLTGTETKVKRVAGGGPSSSVEGRGAGGSGGQEEGSERKPTETSMNLADSHEFCFGPISGLLLCVFAFLCGVAKGFRGDSLKDEGGRRVASAVRRAHEGYLRSRGVGRGSVHLERMLGALVSLVLHMYGEEGKDAEADRGEGSGSGREQNLLQQLQKCCEAVCFSTVLS